MPTEGQHLLLVYALAPPRAKVQLVWRRVAGLSLCLPPAFSLSVCGASPADGCSQVTAGMAGAEIRDCRKVFIPYLRG